MDQPRTLTDSPPALFGAIEAGGTKFVCALGSADGEIAERVSFPTREPAETLPQCIDWLRQAAGSRGAIAAIGIAAFGPVQLEGPPGRRGRILNTPKIAWRDADIVSPFIAAFGCPVGIDTDVNAAALAEQKFGAGIGCDSVAYVTVGTGIGLGLVLSGRPVHGLPHPEAGHILPRRHPDDTAFHGTCPTHGDCLEGLASGTALLARSDNDVEAIPDDSPIWQIEAYYLAQLCLSVALIASPERIVIGGGIMRRPAVLPAIRRELPRLLNHYLSSPCFGDAIADYIVPPGLGDGAGVTGALLLAAAAHGPQNG